jgi:hypothetical protein
MTLPSKVKRKVNRRSNDVQESAADEFRKKALQQAIDDLHVAKYSNGGRLPQGKMEDLLKGLLEIGCSKIN